ncbi:hypothetical protein [Halomarina pelagica]|uniref:hypothetical protein n=1 Tax=Halomarina pelagica TaxID=2961599 RepID=UPI0020C55967|nr:hypothetical protein [Halomarina sp. BND7]
MSTGLHATSGDAGAGATIGVGVELRGWLVARAGLERAQMALSPDATVGDAVERLTDRYGVQVRPALLQGDRLRHDTVALRRSGGDWERVFAGTSLEQGDRVRFEFRE